MIILTVLLLVLVVLNYMANRQSTSSSKIHDVLRVIIALILVLGGLTNFFNAPNGLNTATLSSCMAIFAGVIISIYSYAVWDTKDYMKHNRPIEGFTPTPPPSFIQRAERSMKGLYRNCTVRIFIGIPPNLHATVGGLFEKHEPFVCRDLFVEIDVANSDNLAMVICGIQSDRHVIFLPQIMEIPTAIDPSQFRIYGTTPGAINQLLYSLPEIGDFLSPSTGIDCIELKGKLLTAKFKIWEYPSDILIIYRLDGLVTIANKVNK